MVAKEKGGKSVVMVRIIAWVLTQGDDIARITRLEAAQIDLTKISPLSTRRYYLRQFGGASSRSDAARCVALRHVPRNEMRQFNGVQCLLFRPDLRRDQTSAKFLVKLSPWNLGEEWR